MKAIAAWVSVLLLACGTGEPGERVPEAPPALRAATVIEPPQLRVGDVARIEVAVVTPPDHSVVPLRPPEAGALGPLWLLDAEALPVEKQGARWTHRSRLRVRAREVGVGEFPALRIEVVGPEGDRREVDTEPRRFEVVSVLPTVPDRVSPFPYRLPEVEAPGISRLAAAAGGAASALALVAAVALVRRGRRRAAARALAGEPLMGAPWRAALARIGDAARGADADWRGAADHTAQALRAYVAQRWFWPIDRCTTEEIAGLAPPFVLGTRWPPVPGWLRSLDDLRFRPDAPADAAASVQRIAEQTRRWIEASIPPEAAR
jgi:hypothetical protein